MVEHEDRGMTIEERWTNGEVLSLGQLLDSVPQPDAATVREYLTRGNHAPMAFVEQGLEASEALSLSDPVGLIALRGELEQIAADEDQPWRVWKGMEDEEVPFLLLGAAERYRVKEQRIQLGRFMETATREQFLAVVGHAVDWFEFAVPYPDGKQPTPQERKSSFAQIITQRFFDLMEETDDPEELTGLVQTFASELTGVEGFALQQSVKRNSINMMLKKIPDMPELSGVFISLIEQENNSGTLNFLASRVRSGLYTSDGAARAFTEVVFWLKHGQGFEGVRLPAVGELNQVSMDVANKWLRQLTPMKGHLAAKEIINAANGAIATGQIQVEEDEELPQSLEGKITDVPIAFGYVLQALERRQIDVGQAYETLPFLMAVAEVQQTIEPPRAKTIGDLVEQLHGQGLDTGEIAKRVNKALRKRDLGRTPDNEYREITDSIGPVGAFYYSRRPGWGRFS